MAEYLTTSRASNKVRGKKWALRLLAFLVASDDGLLSIMRPTDILALALQLYSLYLRVPMLHVTTLSVFSSCHFV